MSFAKRSGFTLLELLMVIAIIGMLIALIFPAINRVRETARQTECLTRMQQVGVAIDMYSEKENAYPGWRNPRLHPNRPNVSWLVPILPNLSRKDVYDDWNTVPPPPATAPYPAPATPKLEFVICPTDTAKSGDSQQGPVISFVVNSGRPDNNTDPPDIRSNGIFMDMVTSTTNVSPQRQTPSFVVKADGKANTLLLSENLDATHWSNVGSEAASCMVWWIDPVSTPIGGTGGPTPAGYEKARPSSNHLEGVNIIMASNAGRLLSFDTDYNVYKSMLAVRDQSIDPTP